MSNTQLSSISTTELTTVVGGADPAPGYNGEDVRNAASGASLGARIGGPLGGVIGGGAGFMARNVGNLFGAARDYYNESQRGAQLDAQRRALQDKK
ncbi:MAG TPA: hypothetical protein VFP84_13450 [Kofleriaceae bacterium]|nr:hypothetical protein [Kofleriaceae bacterium]